MIRVHVSKLEPMLSVITIYIYYKIQILFLKKNIDAYMNLTNLIITDMNLRMWLSESFTYYMQGNSIVNCQTSNHITHGILSAGVKTNIDASKLVAFFEQFAAFILYKYLFFII